MVLFQELKIRKFHLNSRIPTLRVSRYTVSSLVKISDLPIMAFAQMLEN